MLECSVTSLRVSEEFLKTNVEFALHPQSPAGFAGLAALGDAVVDGVEELRRRLRDVAPHVRLPVLHVFLALPRAQAGITSPAFFSNARHVKLHKA